MKKVAFKMPKAADQWVGSGGERAGLKTVPNVQMKRFTLDVSVELHKRIKTQCAQRGAKMADVLREVLEREFPHQS